MGYSTDFEGHLNISPALTPEHIAYLQTFNKTRRMKRNPALTLKREDPIRIAAGIHHLGLEGGYFVGEEGFRGQDNGFDVISHNNPPNGQPGLWCGWTVSDDGTKLEWDGVEKFYSYTEWLGYLIKHFFEPWGYVLNGKINWQGEENDDKGIIYVGNNLVVARKGASSELDQLLEELKMFDEIADHDTEAYNICVGIRTALRCLGHDDPEGTTQGCFTKNIRESTRL